MSSNELQSLPAELCSLPSLRDLNVRRNQLNTLPDGEKNEQLGVYAGACVCIYLGEVIGEESSQKNNTLGAQGFALYKKFICS